MLTDLRARGQDLRDVLQRLDALLADRKADRLPAVPLSQACVKIDTTARTLAKLVDQLAAAANGHGKAGDD
jgi:hypothetical protein